jgi:hypothetical protein
MVEGIPSAFLINEIKDVERGKELRKSWVKVILQTPRNH